MAKRPEDRFQTADDLRKSLLDIAELSTERDDRTQMMGALRSRKVRASSPPIATSPPSRYSAWPRRSRWGWAPAC